MNNPFVRVSTVKIEKTYHFESPRLYVPTRLPEVDFLKEDKLLSKYNLKNKEVPYA